ncbi:WD40 repeat domain-containing protein [Mariniblastus sp.]|nr:WD40 repeat domain-containing protein [Mariniblastus sp.]
MTIQHEVAGHQDVISSLAFSPDGERILSGSWDGTAKLWNVKDGTLLHDFSWGAPKIEAVAWTPDGKRIILVGSPPYVFTEQELAASQAREAVKPEESRRKIPKGEVRVYDATDFDLISSFSFDAWEVAVSRCGKKLIVGDYNQISVVQLESGKVIAQFELVGGKSFESVFVSIKDDTIVCLEKSSVWFFDSSLKLKRISTEERLLDEFRNYINELGERDVVLESCADWELRDKPGCLPLSWSSIKKEKFSIGERNPVSRSNLSHVCSSEDGQHIAVAEAEHPWWEPTGARPCGVSILAAESGKLETFLEAPNSKLLRVSTFSPNGDLLASAGDGKKIYVWNIDNGEMASIGEPPSSIEHIVAHSEITQVAFGGTDGRVGIIDVLSRQVLAVNEQRPSSVVHLEFFPDLKSLIAIWADGVIRILDRFSLTIKQELTFPKEHFVGGMVSIDGQHFIGFGFNEHESGAFHLQSDPELVALSLTTGERFYSLPWSPDSPIKSVAASPDRRFIAMASSDRVWIARYDKRFVFEEIWQAPEAYQFGIDFYPDGRQLLLASLGCGMSTLQLASIDQTKVSENLTNDRAKILNEFLAIRDEPTSIVFSSNQKWLVRSTAYCDEFELFDLDTLKLKRLFLGHQNRVNSLQVWQDQIIISGSRDGTVKFWSIESGELIGSVLPVQANS